MFSSPNEEFQATGGGRRGTLLPDRQPAGGSCLGPWYRGSPGVTLLAPRRARSPNEPRFRPERCGQRRQGFTLVELILATGILVTVAAAAFYFLLSAERVTTSSESLSEVYENARVAFSVIERDLRSAVAEAGVTSDRDIRFHSPSRQALWFVRVGDEGEGAQSDVVEVAYKLQGRAFRRASREDTSSDWDIYGTRTDLAGSSTYNTVVDCVVGISFTCQSTDGSTWPVPSTVAEETELPAAVTASLTFVDRRTLGIADGVSEARRAEILASASRTVTKTILLPYRGLE